MFSSIITTVYNRPKRVLFNTFHALRRNNLDDCEVVIINDGSTKDYTRTKHYLDQYELPYRWIDVNTLKDRPGSYSIDGYNNPAYAWNCALDAAKGDHIIMLSSDCVVPPHGVDAMRKCGGSYLQTVVVDLDTATEFLGENRAAPYGWFGAWMRDSAPDIRQDENYLRGIGYDDTDFTARLALATGVVEIDTSVTVWHQSHPQVAYSDGCAGMRINEEYTIGKWGGLPWHKGRTDPLSVRGGKYGHILRANVTRKPNAAPLLEAHGFG